MSERELYRSAQRGLVSSLLFDGSTANRVLEIVTIEDFEEPQLTLVMEAIAHVVRRDETLSVITVARELEKLGKLAEAGGADGLYELRMEGERSLLSAQPPTYAAIVLESAAKFRATQILNENAEVFGDDSGITARDGISEVQNALGQELLRLSDDASTTNVADYVPNYFEVLQEREKVSKENEERSEGLMGIPTLLPSLNRYTFGYMPGQMITVAARTGVGKSVFAVMSIVAAARAGKSVMIFSLEMSRDEIIDRIVSNMSGVSLSRLKQGRISEEDREKVAAATDELTSMKIIIDTDPRSSIDSVRSKALRQWQAEGGLDFIVIDYLQLLSVGRFSSRQEAVADLSRNVKLLANSLGLPIMVLSQLNRSKGSDDSDIPTVDNIRESGAIGQDSDIVILLHREPNTDNITPHTLVILEKNRSGESNKTIRCHSLLECSMFKEIVRTDQVSDNLEDDDDGEFDLSEVDLDGYDGEDFDFGDFDPADM